MAKKVGQRTLKATTTTKIDGKLQPQAIELEQAVLGALMIDNESLSDAIDSLQAEYFYKVEHQKIFEAIVNLFNHTQPVDILTVSEELKRMEELEFIGGLAYISELTNNVASSSNTEFHARIIAEKFIKRSLISISNNIIGDAFNDSVDIFDLLNTAEEKLNRFLDAKIKNITIPFENEEFGDVVDRLEKLLLKYNCEDYRTLIYKILENEKV
jgi:replicative DNA helicase